MNADPSSLEHLHDIIGPLPAPWWPPPPGWLWLLGGLALAALVLLVGAISRWQRNRYRREALAELAALESAATRDAAPQAVAAALANLLKRTALTAYPRTTVANLTGAAWFEFLDRTGGTRFAHSLGPVLAQVTYRAGPAILDGRMLEALIDEVRGWILQHQAVVPGGTQHPPATARSGPHDSGAPRAA